MERLNLILHNVLKKKWTSADKEELIGPYLATYIGYALDERIRYGAASGGVTTAILSHALKNGIIDGALVCRSRILPSNKVRTEFYIATSHEELYDSQDSKYVQTGFVPHALKLVDHFQGKMAIVGLPCDLKVMRKRIARNPKLADKIIFMIGLFCGHNSQPQLIDNVVHKLRPQPASTLNFFRFRTGLWRGVSLAGFDDQVIEKKSSYYKLYQNLYFFCESKCLGCHDHFAYEADISIGDIWSYNLRNKNIKYNAIISKTPVGSEILKTVWQAEQIHMAEVPADDVLDGQARGAPTHNNTSAKRMAGKRFGLNLPDRYDKDVKWHQFFVAWIIIFNYKWSTHPKYAKLIFKIPRKFLKAYLILFKGLESLK